MNRREELVAILTTIEDKAHQQSTLFQLIDKDYYDYRSQLIDELAKEESSFDFHTGHATFALEGQRTFRLMFDTYEEEVALSDVERMVYSDLVSNAAAMYYLLKNLAWENVDADQLVKQIEGRD